MRKRWIATGTILATLGLIPGHAVASAGSARYQVGAAIAAVAAIDPANFVAKVDNPYYPLPAGTTLVYKGIKDGQTQIDRFTVTNRKKKVLGVAVTVVHDVARHNGRLLEETWDWYAQDTSGNVWYFGEDTKAYGSNGSVSTEGSWEAGVHHAVPGIIMEAKPQPPDAYRQEFYAGHAEDTAWILQRGGSIAVPYGKLQHVLLSMEWTRLEPAVIDQKVYAPGIGIVSEVAVAGDTEYAKLVAVHHA
jgi:hypothetical protein